MIFRFTPEADAELTEARQWYSHHRKDLDLEFMQCIEVALSRIQSTDGPLYIVEKITSGPPDRDS